MSDRSSTSPSGLSEWIGVAAGAAVAAAALASSWHLSVMGAFGPGPGLFPRVVGIALLFISLLHALLLLRRTRIATLTAAESDAVAAVDQPPAGGAWAGAARFVAMSASMFVYALVLETAGFLLSTTLLAFVALCLLGRRSLRALVEAVVAVVVLRFAFGQLLGVPLPPAEIPLLNGLGL